MEDIILKKFKELEVSLLKIKALLDISEKSKRLKVLRDKMLVPDFWDNQAKAIEINQESEEIRAEISSVNNLEEGIKEAKELASLAESDDKLQSELEQRYQELQKKVNELEFNFLFSAEYDMNNAYISIHAGVGGVDAQDWAQMLQRMILRFCENKNFKVEILDVNYGNETGIKSAEMKVSGKYAYGYLKSENGAHRLLRNSPFNADGLRQTSFALLEVIPEIKEKELIIKDSDLKIDVYRSSGPGGQSVNTTDSAVRITHLPTKIVVSCQNERSQYQNKENALKILQTKIYKLALEKKEKKEKDLKGDSRADWGRQIRSYFLYGNRLVKDHRSDVETSDVDSVLDGGIDIFIEAYLRYLNS